MDRRITIFISIILIIAAILIHVLLEDANTSLDGELIGFFAGICFGAGIMLPLTLLKKKKNI